MAATPPAKKPAPMPAPRKRALVVGVSRYEPPLKSLPGVAADVKGIAKLLASSRGSFRATGVAELTEQAATQKGVLAALRSSFYGAKADDTIFVYLAGHGGVEKGGYYFLAQDTDPYHLAATGVPLATLKGLFDRTKSRRVFVWLDCCHSGGILSRATTVEADLRAIRREIGVVQGEGKVIMAACTPEQYAYEDPKLGHGLFTHALLEGLKGQAKGPTGEVTAMSLYEFIDRRVTHPEQQPVFSGKMTGRIVLMHYPAAGASVTVPGASTTKQASATAKAGSAGTVSSSGKLLLLDDRVYTAGLTEEQNDGSWKVEIAAKTSEELAALRSLRNDGYGRGRTVSFAYRDDAFPAEVEEVTARSTGATPVLTVSLKPAAPRGDHMLDIAYNGITPEQMAERRARLLLLGEKPSPRAAARDDLLSSMVLGPLKDLKVTGAVLPALRKGWKGSPADFLRHARLRLSYYLRAGAVCDDVFELRLGPEQDGGLAVRFRGRRKGRYSGDEPQEILVEGVCRL